MSWIYWIVILFFVLSLISMLITVYRYRQYLQAGWVMFKMNRQLKQSSAPKNIEADADFENRPQVECGNCRKMMNQDQAVKLKNKYFCSHRCLETAFALKR